MERPTFPKRAVITGGMPYGNKDLHFGHIGGVFVQADVFARFLRDRIGRENVIFVSGTDCYGSPVVESWRQLNENNEFPGSLEEFVRYNHNLQKEVLELYDIDPNLFAASGFGKPSEVHKELCQNFFTRLYENGYLIKMEAPQFYDPEHETFLNGRQVEGQCPINGCQSERGYADECSLGHQYDPKSLLNPISKLSGKKPEFRNAANWYINIEPFREKIVQALEEQRNEPGCRQFMISSILEFFEPPTIHIKKDRMEEIEAIKSSLPDFQLEEGTKKSFRMIFEKLEDREYACKVLTENNIFYRTGKTIVPFRLTGNIDWGVPAPDIEDIKGLTFWVWPESLWAPISFTASYLESTGREREEWKSYWCNKEAMVYQFIGEDNLYFYGLAQIAMFLGDQKGTPLIDPPEGELRLTRLITNNHILFLDKKASSSGKIKPPMARELLDYYTSDQLRAHFFGLGLGIRSVSFRPKPINPNARENDGDPVLKEGNLLSNVLNRAVRSCFYTAQKSSGGRIPVGEITPEIIEQANKTIVEYESAMYRHEFHQVMSVMDKFIRSINKNWAEKMREVNDENNDEPVRSQILIDTFHMVRVASALMHPIAPKGTEMVRDYLGFDESFWSWEHIFEDCYFFMSDPQSHKLKFLEPRVDFFEKHSSQIK